jgi:hypothetical protein
MVPAHERLAPDTCTRRHRHERLVVHLELVSVDGTTEGGLEVETLGRTRSHRVGIEHHVVARATLGLGLVHRNVRIVEDVVARLFGAREGDTDAERRHGLVAVAEADRLAQLAEDPTGNVDRVVGVAHVLEQHGEFVTTEASQQVARAQRLLQPFCHRDQQLVARVVAEAVVDQLEAVDVSEEHRVRLVASARTPDRVIEVIEEEATVRQGRERVVERVLRELLLEDLALGDVPERDHGADRLVAVDDR